MLADTELAGKRPPLNTLTADDVETLRYRQSTLRGRFDFSRQFLLDNKVYEGRPGYEVLTPFFVDNELTVILVNRGWVPQNGDRSVKPDIDDVPLTEALDVTVSGRVVMPSTGVTLGDSIDASEFGWPLVVQYPDYQTIAEKLDRIQLVHAMLVLSAGQAWNYTYNWQPVANGPEKHYGYAFQWFALLLAVITFFVYLNFIKKDE